MQVVKRSGKKEDVMFDKITSRIQRLCYGLTKVDAVMIAQKVISGVYNNVTTCELDELAAETAATLSSRHPEYAKLAGRISISNLHKQTNKVFSEVVIKLFERKNSSGNPAPGVSEELHSIVLANKNELDGAIVYDRDYSYDFFASQTLQRAYLLKDIDDKILERPQHMIMRVSIGIHGNNIADVLKTYHAMSNLEFTHATPTMYNAGTPYPQMSSCFLTPIDEDSIDGIFKTLTKCAKISKSAGGVGISVSNIRAQGTFISGSGGKSNGLVPMLRVYDNTARYVDQGGGKRKGAFAIYLEPWHADISDFLMLKINTGNHEDRARDLFYGLWIPDLFMKRVKSASKWSLMCPHECPGLDECWGEKFEALYEKYEREGKVKKVVDSQILWKQIIDTQIETGMPYMLFKDACNSKSNHQHLGTIKCSNLCTEIIEYSSPSEVAVCNLASIALPKFVTNGKYDFERLKNTTMLITQNLDRIIQRNFYPVEEAKNSNMRHRPIGIGVQGLADVFFMLKYPFDSPEAAQLNIDIFETIYFASLTASCELAKKYGRYESFDGSPTSKGILQFDMWGVKPSDRWDFGSLKKEIVQHGLRNSLLVAPMPTASTAQILGNNECFEPYTSNMYTRRVLAGEFILTNTHLVKDLENIGMWNSETINQIKIDNGSVQNLNIPTEMKRLYRTCWEIKMKPIISMAADRGPYIDQSQSLNAFISEPTLAKLSTLHFMAWDKGLKTGMYYLRTRGAADAIKFTCTSCSA